MVTGGNLSEALVSVVNVEVKGGCVWCERILYFVIVVAFSQHDANAATVQDYPFLAVVIGPLAHYLPVECLDIKLARHFKIARGEK